MYLRCGYIPRDNAAGRGDSAMAYVHTRTYKSSGPDPCAVFNSNRPDFESESGIGPIVIAGAEIYSLRDTYVGSDCNGRKIVDPNILANPGVLGNG